MASRAAAGKAIRSAKAGAFRAQTISAMVSAVSVRTATQNKLWSEVSNVVCKIKRLAAKIAAAARRAGNSGQAAPSDRARMDMLSSAP